MKNIATKRYRIACKYKDETIQNIPKYQIEYDLEALGVTVKPFFDKETLEDILKVVCTHIIKSIEEGDVE